MKNKYKIIVIVVIVFLLSSFYFGYSLGIDAVVGISSTQVGKAVKLKVAIDQNQCIDLFIKSQSMYKSSLLTLCSYGTNSSIILIMILSF